MAHLLDFCFAFLAEVIGAVCQLSVGRPAHQLLVKASYSRLLNCSGPCRILRSGCAPRRLLLLDALNELVQALVRLVSGGRLLNVLVTLRRVHDGVSTTAVLHEGWTLCTLFTVEGHLVRSNRMCFRTVQQFCA